METVIKGVLCLENSPNFGITGLGIYEFLYNRDIQHQLMIICMLNYTKESESFMFDLVTFPTLEKLVH